MDGECSGSFHGSDRLMLVLVLCLAASAVFGAYEVMVNKKTEDLRLSSPEVLHGRADLQRSVNEGLEAKAKCAQDVTDKLVKEFPYSPVTRDSYSTWMTTIQNQVDRICLQQK